MNALRAQKKPHLSILLSLSLTVARTGKQARVVSKLGGRENPLLFRSVDLRQFRCTRRTTDHRSGRQVEHHWGLHCRFHRRRFIGGSLRHRLDILRFVHHRLVNDHSVRMRNDPITMAWSWMPSRVNRLNHERWSRSVGRTRMRESRARAAERTALRGECRTWSAESAARRDGRGLARRRRY